ncbi:MULTISPECIES: NnrS family protein [unclassified Ruegeria]|uniref:NnrS family protein n=1 Tax=unclassified Ruegeria TaxID=2625375 RepID=UPI00149293E3|nr:MULTISPECIES: NnrS family protein [unclassified Ruegeria]NOD47381.1 NnrS family protein [Ruegeria sp. HKCCD5849]NOD53226.1 NnrS family protein [Ruegeria sp. HKCCD5851]NOD66419.1 NnrS family protein [Ruegeria sp. HKCCD7303]
MSSVITRVFSEGFRVFFLLAGLYGVFAGVAWGVWLASLDGLLPFVNQSYAMPPVMWHAHEMIFGYATAALGGFFLTAVPNWTGAPEARARFITVVALLWIAGRIAVWFSGSLSPVTVALVDLSFVPILALKVASQLIRRPKPQNIVFLYLLGLIWTANLLIHLDWIGVTSDTLITGVRAGLLAICSMIAILGGRITPAFTRNAMKREGQPEASWPVSVPQVDKAVMILALLLPLLVLTFNISPVAGGVALLLGCVQLVRMARWRVGWALRRPILIALHLGLGMLALGLILWGLATVGFGNEIGALHILGIGCVGGMTLAVMSRAALGHSGRPLVAPSPMVVAYGLMAAAALVRWLGSELTGGYMAAMLAADGLWIAAVGLYVFAMWPALTGPRVSRPS